LKERLVTAAQRRAAVTAARAAAELSERPACRFLGVSRTGCRYRSRRPVPSSLRERLVELASQRTRWGYRRLHVLLRREGYRVNWKRIYRLYRAADLTVRKRRRKRISVPRQPLLSPPQPNERWSIDFVSDALANGRRFRGLAIVDDCTRECPAMEVDTSLSGSRVVDVLERLAVTRGVPRGIVLDNGPEFSGKALDAWAFQRGVRLLFIQSGKPMQNAYAESFIGRLRDECLNENWFLTLGEGATSGEPDQQRTGLTLAPLRSIRKTFPPSPVVHVNADRQRSLRLRHDIYTLAFDFSLSLKRAKVLRHNSVAPPTEIIDRIPNRQVEDTRALLARPQ
jgi:putative transposase